jgi:retron-type reverse transcriptase
MPRSHNRLWPEIISWPNLLRAYHRARRRKRYKPPACRFHEDWEAQLLRLQRELAEGTFRPGPYHNFYVHEPKRRLISAAPFRDRVVHHAVVQVIEPLFERKFIFDSYACRRGKGTHRALDRAHEFLKRHRYFLKCDIVKFFPSVDHEILLRVVARTVRDRDVMELLGCVLASGKDVLRHEAPETIFPGDDLWAALRPRGIPIGNLTSQFLANVYLNELDHFVKEVLRCGAYVRYADDFVLFGEDKGQLWAWCRQIASLLVGLRLVLHRDKTIVSPRERGLRFLGFKLHPRGRRLLNDAVVRFRRRLRRYRRQLANRSFPVARLTHAIRAWIAHTEHGNCVGLRRSLFRTARFRRGCRAAINSYCFDPKPPAKTLT